MIRTGRIEQFKSGVARRARELLRALPAPVRIQFNRAVELAFRRRRILALPAILALHVLILAGLALAPPRSVPAALIFVDLSPLSGEGPKFPIEGAPSLSKVETKVDTPDTADAPPSEAPDETEPTPPDTPDIERPKTEAQVTPSDAVEANSSQASTDVLAMVETMIGANAAAISEPASVATPVSNDLFAEIRIQQARIRAAGVGGGCAIDALLRQALSTDAVVQAALKSIPSADKSVSNALQLWDGDWTLIDASGAPDPLAAVRAKTIAVVNASPAACQNAPVRGPRFVIVPVQDGADIVIVIGSGEWRWRDILPPKPASLFRWLGLNR